jgi:hypothetical protein
MFRPQEFRATAAWAARCDETENLWEISLTEPVLRLGPNSSKATTDDYDSMRIFMHGLLFCPLR